jgi:NDP-sugar pyrophosphorylase family protein
MEAFILAGGLGSRLAPYTLTIPKPMLPIGNVPILEVVVRQLANFRFERVYISLGYLPHLVKAHLDSLVFSSKIEIIYIHEDAPLGTAGALSKIEPPSKNSALLVMNGDLLTDLDFEKFLLTHEENGADATIALTKRQVFIDYGVVHHDSSSGILKEFEEKPTIFYDVCMGIYALSATAWEQIEPEKFLNMPDLLQKLASINGTVLCQMHDGYWQDIGRVEDFSTANRDFITAPERFL